MAGKQVQRRRGTTAQHTPFIGAMGEVTVDTVKFVEVVHDGTTPGGFPQASARDIVNATAATDAKLALKVSQDSATGVAKIPSGTTGQRPVTPQVGDFRYNSTTKKFEGYADAALGWAPVGGDSIPLFSVFWFSNRAAIPAGFVVGDGQALTRATYPDAWAGIAAGNVPIATEANWGANAGYRGCYTTGDGTSWFRMPDYNGKSPGSHGSTFLRGDGTGAAGLGVIQQSQNVSHTHGLASDSGGVVPVVASDGGSQKNAANKLQYLGNDALGNYPLYVVGSGGSEAHPINVTGCWAVKLFGAVINPGAADAAQLATEVANIKADIQNNYYRRNNVVGPVSQSGGLNTGAIIQAGGNANGMFIRFADGNQLCYNYIDLGGLGISAPVGSLFYRAINSLAFPIAFIQFPYVNLGVVTGSGLAWASQGSNFPSATLTQGWYVLNPVSATTTGTALWFAHGRWV